MSEMYKNIANALNLRESTLHVYLSKNTAYPAAMRAKEYARSVGWTPSYTEHVPNADLLARVDQKIQSLQPMEKLVSMEDIAKTLGVSIHTVKRAYANTDHRNVELESRIRKAGQIMGYIPGHKKPYKIKPAYFWYGGNYHSKADEVARMKQLRQEGYTNQEIARKIGRAYNTVLNNIGKQDPLMTETTRQMAAASRKQKSAARAAYVRNKPIAEYNAKVQEHNELKAKLNALQVELLTEKPQIEQAAKIAVTAPQMNLVNLQPTALN